jgi:serine/threonine-protein kinase ULK4
MAADARPGLALDGHGDAGADDYTDGGVIGVFGQDSGAIEALIWHASDSTVKPIVANRRIERLPEPRYEARGLPFTPLSLTVRTGI